MKKIIISGLKFIFFFSLGIAIFWLIYKDQDLNRIVNVLQYDVNYTWIWVSIGLGLMSHISRTIRWVTMIEALGQKPSIVNTFLAVMVGYLMNLALPRMGEISRCGVLSRYEKISFAKLLGTVLAERIVDMIMLILFTLLVIFTQFGQLVKFLKKNPEIQDKLQSVLQSPYFIAGVIIIIVLLVIIKKTSKNTLLSRKIGTAAANFKEGLVTIRNIDKKGIFLFHSVLIWVLYYLMLYALFFSFDFTSGLSPIAGMTTFVLSSYGMVAPVQGGIGAWHFMAKESLSLYGVANANGIIFALVAHTSMTVMIIVLGFASWLILPFINRKLSVPDN